MSSKVKNTFKGDYRDNYRKFILFVAPLGTLIVSPFWNFDPISSIKMIPIVVVAFGLGTICTFNDSIRATFFQNRLFASLVLGFIASLFIPLLFSGTPLSQQFWGVFGRNTGFLSYLSLVVILALTAILVNRGFIVRLNQSLFLTGIALTFYGFIQYFKLDPIDWSEKQAFGTLGNVNFMSAFLGMVVCISLAYFLDSTKRNSQRILALSIVILDIFLIISTGSIQGLMVIGFGTAILVSQWLSTVTSSKPILLISFTGFITVGSLGFLGILNKGPLAKFIFQPSILFRADYMHAGIEMTAREPLTGVGLDSYGDWYREARGEISTLRTGPDRIANTAHNIFLDISSGGGLFLGIFYLALNVLALTLGLKYFIRLIELRKNDFVFIGAFACWLGYLSQALVSINQLGVGIWGWVYNGAVIGLCLKKDQLFGGQTSDLEVTEERVRKAAANTRQRSNNYESLNSRDFMLFVFGGLLGLTLAVIPARADAAYKAATQKAVLEEIVKSTRVLGSTQFHSEMVLDQAIKIEAKAQAIEIAEYIVDRYPRSYFAWRALYVLPGVPEARRQQAGQKLLRLDPFNPFNSEITR